MTCRVVRRSSGRNLADLCLKRFRGALAGGAPLDRARLLARLAQVHMLAGSFKMAVRLGREAQGLADGTDDESRAIAAHVVTTLGAIDGWSGRIDRAVERLSASLVVAEELGRVDDAFRCRANLASYKCPRFVVFRELPMTSTGKVQKYVLRDWAKTA